MEAEFGGALLKMAGSLMLILGIMVSLFYVLKRLRPRSFHLSDYPQMRLIGSLNLAPKRTIALVELCDQWLVVGVGTESVNLIAKMDRPPEVTDAGASVSHNGRGFQSFLESSSLWQQWRNLTVKRKHEES